MSWVDDTRAGWIAWMNLVPPPTDDQATMALTLALQAVETWLDRPLELVERIEEHAPTLGVVWLRAWPIESIAGITSGDDYVLDTTAYVFDRRTGRVGLAGCRGVITATYTGGFDPMPVDLQLALWQVAATLYPQTLSSTGGAGGQEIKRITTPDVGTVEYVTSDGGDGTADDLLGGAISPQVSAMLARYRAESVVGGA